MSTCFRKERNEIIKKMFVGLDRLGRENPTREAIYLESLKEISDERLKEAVDYLLRNATEVPMIAELLEGINSGLYRTVKRVEGKCDWEALCRKMDMDDLAMTEEEYDALLESEEGYEIPGVDV